MCAPLLDVVIFLHTPSDKTDMEIQLRGRLSAQEGPLVWGRPHRCLHHLLQGERHAHARHDAQELGKVYLARSVVSPVTRLLPQPLLRPSSHPNRIRWGYVRSYSVIHRIRHTRFQGYIGLHWVTWGYIRLHRVIYET